MNKRIRFLTLIASFFFFGALLNYPMHSQAAHGPGVVTWADLQWFSGPHDEDYSNVYMGAPGTEVRRLIGTSYVDVWGDASNYKVFGYDEAGKMAVMTDVSPGGAGSQETFQYDAQGRLVRVNNYVSGNLVSWTVYTRNAQGQIIRSNGYNDSAPSGHGYIDSEYTYSDGKLVYIAYTSYVNGGSHGSISFTYDAFGNLISEASRYYTNTYEYDSFGRLIRSYVFRNGSSGDATEYFYDKDGFLTRINHNRVVYYLFYETVGTVQPAAPQASTDMIDGFDPAFYAQAYSDVVAALGNDPLTLYTHYLLFGKAEGRLPHA